MTTYRAKWVLPISSPPIENGFIVVRGDVIVKVGRQQEFGHDIEGKSIDLGDVAVMPGLVNAHTHLEFSELEKPIGNPGMELADWIGEVIRQRGQTISTADTIAKGLDQCKRSGTVLVGEIATTPWLGALDISGETEGDTDSIEVIAMAETLGLSSHRADDKFALAQSHLQRWGEHAGISPHAPYSTPPELIRRCVELARRTDSILAMHVAESVAERELLMHGTGPFADSLRAIGLPIDETFPWSTPTPVIDLIRTLAQAPTALLVHANDLHDDELDELCRHRHLSVVYCPRTHHFFRHRPHRVGELINAGVNVALGTDSRASNPDLSLWGEVQFLLNHRQDLDPHLIFRIATLGGAIALRRENVWGNIQPGRRARLIGIPTSANQVSELPNDLASSNPFVVVPVRN
ncbi:Aminodeoxyfutalosine deaminase [Neorhodopirellula pilleata]|uniref:Aminodeoxyfutalosine deaminase n=1 Tax=Neorhodopirellula pilleata TaxID=2714738 RepID=A0A5C6ABK6_9BACT|nr:Aminodeoxyfutalosine deaminase [Neorhodopirellula pilleata]